MAGALAQGQGRRDGAERLTRDRVLKTEESCRGVLRWQRPDDPNQPLRISLKMGPAEEPDGFIFTGTHLYDFAPRLKEVRVTEMTKLFDPTYSPEKNISG